VAEPGIVGINLYPLYSNKVLAREGGRLRIRAPYGTPSLVGAIAGGYWRRYRRPVMITETASAGSLARRQAWLDGSVAAVRALRGDGIPLIGYTWWPLFALVAWAYRQGGRPVADHLVQMGLWDLDGRLDRRRTPLVDAYAALVAGGSSAVGSLQQGARHVS
jgi:hypothetical protein